MPAPVQSSTPEAAVAPEADDGVVQRVLGGDTEAFAVIVQRYERDLWKVAAQLGGDPVATENLVQQSFVNAYEHLDQYQAGRGLGPWLAGIARNVVRKELRSRSREHRWLTHYHRQLIAAFDHEDDQALEQRRRRIEQALKACRQGLAPGIAEALELRYQEGLSVEAVAAAIGRTVGATRQLLFRARAALRLCVEGRLAAE